MQKLAYTIDEAAEQCGYSRDTLEDARDRKDLPFRYANRKPVILHTDLQAWLESLPTDPEYRIRRRR